MSAAPSVWSAFQRRNEPRSDSSEAVDLGNDVTVSNLDNVRFRQYRPAKNRPSPCNEVNLGASMRARRFGTLGVAVLGRLTRPSAP